MPDAVVIGVFAVIALLVALSVLARIDTVTVYEWQRGMRYRNGKFDAIIDPGRYRIWRPTMTILPIDVRDLMLPAATKRLYAQIVEARQRGLAALEQARGETAALRSLANAASLIEKSPTLFQLRLLQQMESSSGNTFVIGTAGITPVAAPAAAPPTSTTTAAS